MVQLGHLKIKQNYVPNKQIHLSYELGTNFPRQSPGEVLSFLAFHLLTILILKLHGFQCNLLCDFKGKQCTFKNAYLCSNVFKNT